MSCRYFKLATVFSLALFGIHLPAFADTTWTGGAGNAAWQTRKTPKKLVSNIGKARIQLPNLGAKPPGHSIAE